VVILLQLLVSPSISFIRRLPGLLLVLFVLLFRIFLLRFLLLFRLSFGRMMSLLFVVRLVLLLGFISTMRSASAFAGAGACGTRFYHTHFRGGFLFVAYQWRFLVPLVLFAIFFLVCRGLVRGLWYFQSRQLLYFCIRIRILHTDVFSFSFNPLIDHTDFGGIPYFLINTPHERGIEMMRR